eukprot:scaffold14530_cov217-Amphora_coffeaeformis.AAC.3
MINIIRSEKSLSATVTSGVGRSLLLLGGGYGTGNGVLCAEAKLLVRKLLTLGIMSGHAQAHTLFVMSCSTIPYHNRYGMVDALANLRHYYLQLGYRANLGWYEACTPTREIKINLVPPVCLFCCLWCVDGQLRLSASRFVQGWSKCDQMTTTKQNVTKNEPP